jgi:glycerol uptake facilitator-like aquaporin
MMNRQKVGMLVAEFIGTAILALTAMGAARYFNFTAPWYVGLAVGVSLAALVGIIGKVSGAHVNPAITLGLWTLKRIPTTTAIAYVGAQLLGGLTAFAFVEYVTNSDIVAAGMTSFDTRIFVAELVGTAIFGFGVAAVVMQKIEGMQAAFTIGASLFLGILVAAVAAPGFLNPAVALGFNAWDRTTVIAPLIGSVIGMNLYSFFLAPTESLRPVKVVAKKSSKKR